MLAAYSRRVVFLILLLATLSPSTIFARDKHAISPCDKPREIASQPKFSKEQSERVRELRAQGQIDVSVNEDGEVVEAKVVRLYSRGDAKEAVDLLLAFARSAKFKPRAGCGVTHTAINYTFAAG